MLFGRIAAPPWHLRMVMALSRHLPLFSLKLAPSPVSRLQMGETTWVSMFLFLLKISRRFLPYVLIVLGVWILSGAIGMVLPTAKAAAIQY